MTPTYVSKDTPCQPSTQSPHSTIHPLLHAAPDTNMDLTTISSVSVSSSKVSRKKGTKKKRRNRPRNDQRFADYLVFGLQSTLCLCLFVTCYALVLIILWPLLKASTPENLPDETPRDYMNHMHVPPTLKEIIYVPGQEKLGEMASGLRKRLERFRQGRGATDAQLLDQASAEFEARRKQNRERKAEAVLLEKELDDIHQQNAKAAEGHDHNGFVVLGMHRSGTSMLSGLLHQSAGYQVGGVSSKIGGRCQVQCITY
jgi:Sec-independent protein translocase protein TatA